MFDRIKINDTIINNRIIRSATNEHLGSLNGLITDEYIKVYSNLSANNVGLIITSHMAVDSKQRVDETQICVNDPRNFENLNKLSKTVHKNGSRILAQLSQGGKKVYRCNDDIIPLTPSNSKQSIEMSINDINTCVNNFLSAAKNIETAGFDGVQLHLAHGYLLSDFLDLSFNQRNDLYGGSLIKCYRIVHEIIKSIRKFCNRKFILAVKINSTSTSKNFLIWQTEICKMLQNDGVDLIEISGMEFAKRNECQPYFLEEALEIKKFISIPIALVGGFRTIEQINVAINKGIDFISLSRPFICEEDLVLKLMSGKDSICNDCNQCYSIYKKDFKRCIFHNEINKQLYLNFKN